ncbi:GGDEF domain-containing protein [Photobacterium phosphoreum]|uniref:GGDEF domain-containing protein n=1 Tax=Photobacterium phosphoreum TaxID=659 RepID=UPI000CF533EA|nr:GGDEF domain-containing protein [Photobacterium phosphoreum]MCD9478906.1 diguanylate cyclase [Photobacterium phosphoreum]MCD9483007.1 diguanylate cyclase [Photobacterium phosphoreum]PQJ91225.1 GGDEF domain-containing protein [Photobacterium phosphoreum]PSU40267.1 GGDEF domain-containing protein [Photobacterium phosphoreum]PSV71224.1 GGDEF domain-containing protein [Photobacterium phosphoreum]
MTGLNQWLRLIVLFLVCFTLAAYGWFVLGGAKTEYIVTPKNSKYKIIDDSIQNGATTATLGLRKNDVLLECNIINQAKWPFCEIAISLTDSIEEGIDLSSYHSVGLDIDYTSPLNGERIRVYLRNFDPAYAKTDDPLSLKFNAIEYSPGIDAGLQVFPLRTFQVLSWWIAENNIPVDKSNRQFDNISIIEIATGSYVKESYYAIKLNRIVFYGEWITESSLVKLLLLLWVITAVIVIIIERFILQKKIKNTEERSLRLRDANRLLYNKSLKFEYLACTDPLTRIRNRHTVTEWAEEITIQTQRNQIPFSMIFIDLDHFKSVNDTYGHSFGDEVLVKFAATVETLVRRSDVFARWGGEEFVVFCPETNMRTAVEIAEDIRETIATKDWGFDREFNLTCSLGVAELVDETCEDLIKRADLALLKAKKMGRNRIEISWEHQQLK